MEAGTLYIVATPIGNLSDITLRAIETLKKVDLIICEDTRVTANLLKSQLISKPLMAYHDHSDEFTRKKIINKLLKGDNLALVSDAGTPLIADPGYKLVHELKSLNINVETIPGPCSIIAALTIAGLPTDRFMFVGFLPHKSSAKKQFFEEIKDFNSTLVCFENANRLLESLELMKDYFLGRQVSVNREITKLFQESITDEIDNVIDYYQENPDKLRGEIVLCIAPGENQQNINEQEIMLQLKEIMKNHSLRDAVDIVASQYPISKKNIYKLAIKTKEN